MAILRIRTVGDPVLRKVARPIETIDETIVRLAEAMIETMRAYRGIGLAATQVARPVSLVVVPRSNDKEDYDPVAVVNPVLHGLEGEQEGEEGCLSVPGFSEEVTRSARCVLTGQDLAGRDLCLEGRDLQARVFQHELDHLKGVLYIDYLSPLKRELLLRKIQRNAAGEE
jgi:peptide deformylase